MRFVASLAFSDPSHFLDVARAAEAAGWDGLGLSDHLVFPEQLASAYPYVEGGKPFWESSTPWPDPWVAAGAMGAVTTRLRFMTNIYVLPARHPLVVAKAVGTAAVLTNNRIVLGVGVGWMREEFEMLGVDFAGRGKRTDEMIAVLRTLWRGGMVEHHGTSFSLPRLEMSPAPTAPVPIFVGGESGPALRRAARLGDGWISVLHTVDELRALIARLNDLRREYGRESEPFDFVVSCTDAFDLDGYRRLADAGATTVLTAPWIIFGEDPVGLDGKRRGLERFGDEVIARLR